MTGRAFPFEADLEPETRYPRVRWNFANGWSASLLLSIPVGRTCGVLASVTCAPTGQWSKGLTELGPTEADADEAMAWIDAVRRREPPAATQEMAA